MNATQRNRLRTLANFLAKIPDNQFRLESWVTRWDAVRGCGTVACAGGWAPHIWPTHFRHSKRDQHYPVLISHPDLGPFDALGKFFGLEDPEYLFDPARYNGSTYLPVPKDVVVDRIREVARKGEPASV